MPRAYSATAAAANSGGAETCTGFPEKCTVSQLQIAVTKFIKDHQPKKTWTFVADLFGLRERSAKHRLANSVAYTAEEIQLLLHGDNGREVLDLLMADAKPDWWKEWCKTWELTAIRCEQAKLQQRALSLDNTTMDLPSRRKLKRFIDADRNLSATRAEKETLVGAMDSYRDRAVAGAVVATAGKTKIPAAGMRAGARRG
jgi:hypothetical protein